MSDKSTFGADLLGAMTEALSHAEGKYVAGLRLTSVDLSDVDAKSIRQKLHLTQDEMAEFLGTNTSGYRKWEQGTRQPSGAARTVTARDGT
jgi:putative transcriptional regulator